jgi:hypothetical protein
MDALFLAVRHKFVLGKQGVCLNLVNGLLMMLDREYLF